MLERTHLSKFPTPKQCPSLFQLSPTSLNLKVTPSELYSPTYTKEHAYLFLTPSSVYSKAKVSKRALCPSLPKLKFGQQNTPSVPKGIQAANSYPKVIKQ